INKTDGLSHNVVKSITKDRNNNIWLGLANGHLNKVKQQNLHISNIEIPEKTKFRAGIRKIILDEAHQSLFLASENGFGMLHEIYSDQYTFTLLNENSQSTFVIKDFSLNKNSTLALALSSGIALVNYLNNKLEFDIHTRKEGFNFFSDRAYSVFYDQNQKLWFSNINGLKILDPEHNTINFKKSLLNKRINDIEQLPDGTMVLATDGYGLILIKGNKIIRHLTKNDGLASNICKKIFISNNQIWLVTLNGVNKVSLNNQQAEITAFDYTNALLKNDINDVYVDADTSYFATNTGLVYFFSKPHGQIVENPKALISSIFVDEKKRSLKDAHITLNPNSKKITFYFGVVDFQGQDILYRYRLRTHDEWTETKNKRIEATALEPGDYTFEVSAKSNTSSWGPSMKINFELKSSIWQSTWFLLILFLIAGIFFYGVAVVVTKKQKNKEQQKLLLKNRILMLEQQALQAMMNPHFVFNVMNSIQHYINTKDTGSANRVLTGFARLIRKNMEICTKSYISLQEELEYLELYLSLEKKRFGDKLTYTIHIDPLLDKEETVMPSMLLQPYIENAIWHGIMPIDKGGELKITILMKDQHVLQIEISDNGIGIDNSLKYKKNSHTSKGMSLTQERVNLLNQINVNPVQIKIQQTGASGTSVVISITLPS
uniref:sensor histidine kinase n=1 Tax=Pedobacter sp. TaxID=1411316 RepID=UPI003D7F7EA2